MSVCWPRRGPGHLHPFRDGTESHESAWDPSGHRGRGRPRSHSVKQRTESDLGKMPDRAEPRGVPPEEVVCNGFKCQGHESQRKAEKLSQNEKDQRHVPIKSRV